MAGDAVDYTEANVGFALLPVGDAVDYTEADVLPATGQQAWGVPIGGS